MTKKLMMSLMVILGLAIAPAHAQGTQGPDALAKSVTDEVLALLRADKDIQAGNVGKVVEVVEKKVLPHFDFTRMTQLAVGRHWQQATPEQQKALTVEFRSLLVQTYASMLAVYRDQKVEYRPLRVEPSETDVVVRSRVMQASGAPIPVDYRMRKTDAGWKVYDVAIGDASLVQTYRNTFSSEIQRGGVDGLIKSLADKNKQLASDTRTARK